MAWLGHRLALAGAVVAAVAAACTVFNGLSVAPAPGPDATPGDSGTADALDSTVVSMDAQEAAPPLTYLSVAQGAALCTLAATCQELSLTIQLSVGVPIDANNFSLCMEWASGPIPSTRQGFMIQDTVLQCMAQASSCDAAAACSVFETIEPNDPRCANDAGNACQGDGSVGVNCSTGYVEYCQNGGYTPGEACYVGTDGLTACALGPLDASCPGTISCINNFEDFCGTDNLHIRYNCQTFGDPCVYADAGAQCGEACDVVGALVCDGNVVKSCDGTEESPFDCADLGGTCSSKNNTIYCARPGDTCTPLDSDVNVCSGTMLSLCVGGTKTSFDCSTIDKQCVQGVVPQTPHCG